MSVTVEAVSSSVLVCGSGEGVESLADALADEPVTVAQAGDAVTALEHLETGYVDCVVAPGRVGELELGQFLRELRSRGYGGPVVGLAGEEDLGSVLGADVDQAVPVDDPPAATRGVLDTLASERLEAAKAARRRLRSAISDAEAAMAVAEAREAVEQALVDALVAGSVYRSGWVGRYAASDEPDADVVEPAVAAGLPVAHLADRPVDGPTAVAVEEGGVVVEREGTETTVVVPLGEEPEGVLYLNADRPAGVSEAERTHLADLGVAAGEALTRVASADDRSPESREETPAEPAVADPQPVDTDGLSVLGDVLAHELSNQLDVATTHLGLARDREDDEEHFDHVDEALERMSELADDAEALARGDVDSQPCALEEMAETAWSRVDTGDSTLETEQARLWADEQQLTLLLENLLRNAVEHGPEEGEQSVRVRVEPLEDGGFVVADDGRGIPPAEREAVLEWGYSGGDGSGVGLGVVRLVAERHDWTVEVGESDGGGAAITLG